MKRTPARIDPAAFPALFRDAYGRDAVEPELLRTVAAIEAFG